MSCEVHGGGNKFVGRAGRLIEEPLIGICNTFEAMHVLRVLATRSLAFRGQWYREVFAALSPFLQSFLLNQDSRLRRGTLHNHRGVLKGWILKTEEKFRERRSKSFAKFNFYPGRKSPLNFGTFLVALRKRWEKGRWMQNWGGANR